MTTILFAAKSERWITYEPCLRDALEEAGLGHARLTTEADAAEVDYIVYAPNSGLTDFTPFTRLKAVLNLWAGVEDVVGNQTLTVPLARMVDDGLTEGMVEWVTGHVLRHHLGIDTHIHGQDGLWRTDSTPPLARDRTVAILGLGVLGTACAQMLASLNFRTLGWSRSPKAVPGVICYHGAEGLRGALREAQIVVLLLPDTPATENTLNAETLALMPKGAVILNPGRGPIIDDDALLAARSPRPGQNRDATLDDPRTEPLPGVHALRSHPRSGAPHIASAPRTASASAPIVENIRRARRASRSGLVDRAWGLERSAQPAAGRPGVHSPAPRARNAVGLRRLGQVEAQPDLGPAAPRPGSEAREERHVEASGLDAGKGTAPRRRRRASAGFRPPARRRMKAIRWLRRLPAWTAPDKERPSAPAPPLVASRASSAAQQRLGHTRGGGDSSGAPPPPRGPRRAWRPASSGVGADQDRRGRHAQVFTPARFPCPRQHLGQAPARQPRHRARRHLTNSVNRSSRSKTSATCCLFGRKDRPGGK